MELTSHCRFKVRFRGDNPTCTHNPPTKARDLNMAELHWVASQYKGRVPHAGLLLWGKLTHLALILGSINTLVESDLLSYMVSGLETSLSQGIPLAEGLACQPKGLAIPIPGPLCVCDHGHHIAGQLDSQDVASRFYSLLSVVKKFWPLSGLYLPHWCYQKCSQSFLAARQLALRAILISFFLFICDVLMVTFIGSSFMAS